MGKQMESALLQSIHRVLVMLASVLPGVLVALLSLVLFTLIGVGIAALLRKALQAMKFDERLAQRETHGSPANVADWSPQRSPSLLISRTALWICILAGIAVGAMSFDASYHASSTITAFMLPYVTHLTGAILLFLAGNLVARFLERSVLIGAVNSKLQYARFLSLGIKWLVLVLTAAMVLDHLQIGGVVVELAFGILFGGIVLTLSLAIGLGSRDLVSSSIERTMEKPADAAMPPDREGSEPRTTLRHF